MSEQKQILERYLREKFRDKPALTIVRLEKIADGWESDNHVVTIEYGIGQRTREDRVWRIYSGAGNREKAEREFSAMRKLSIAGYPVPRVFLLEVEQSPIGKPFVVMEFIQGEVMWDLLDNSPKDKRRSLLDQFCQLYARLHALDWKQFDDSLPDNKPFFFIDRWLDEARGVLHNFPEVDAYPFLDWVTTRRELFACERPSPVHQDFHPGNILVNANDDAAVIDWTNFAVTDSRFDLAWTLMLAYAYGGQALQDQILQGYQHHAGKPLEQLEVFEAIACARRLLDLTISLTQGAQRMGMNAQAVEAMRANMEAHGRVYQLFVERTGLQIQAFDCQFG